MNQFDRVFALHRQLAGRRVVRTLAELCESLECSEATLKRTIRELRDVLGAPLVFDRQQGGYRYEGEAVYELPGLWFSPRELTALLLLQDVLEQQPVGLLADTLRPFRSRIERLAAQGGIGIPEWRTRLRLLKMAARPPGEMFLPVATALAQGRRLSIDYHSRGVDTMRRRRVSPQRLTLYRENWYLDAWCHQQNALRTFSLDRIIAAEQLEEAVQSVEPAILDAVLATSYGIFSGPPTALARLHFSDHAARWVATENWHPQQRDQAMPGGGLIRELPYHRAEELLMDILRYGPDVEVLDPPALREVLISRLDAARARYVDRPKTQLLAKEA
ncbi:WYL domain-containing protein [Solimonas sp. K1W22B-7]|uniref:helix-turn-helix transcriptional regulator n=1 Tax=Solimonas sp. K1W22B-7 TaxID=2303331 RepID=UPI000E3334EA|nr:WYL domain-containing protein [Solimonas sp. K1W22B-7]AXQ28789.1 WYL domain-containing protein [Solimonas sp. K1W22B-7]